MPEKRSDSDILRKILKLTFGDKEYEVPVLRMAAAAEWRKKFFEMTRDVASDLPANFDEQSADLKSAISRGVFGALIEFPNKIPDLVFSYAPSLPKEEILEAAYDSDFKDAFQAIWGVAFAPFLSSLGMILEMEKARASNSPYSASTNAH